MRAFYKGSTKENVKEAKRLSDAGMGTDEIATAMAEAGYKTIKGNPITKASVYYSLNRNRIIKQKRSYSEAKKEVPEQTGDYCETRKTKKHGGNDILDIITTLMASTLSADSKIRTIKSVVNES